MKPSTDDKATGTLHEVKGAIKQKAGELTNDRDLAADGEERRMQAKFNTLSVRLKRPWEYRQQTFSSPSSGLSPSPLSTRRKR